MSGDEKTSKRRSGNGNRVKGTMARSMNGNRVKGTMARSMNGRNGSSKTESGRRGSVSSGVLSSPEVVNALASIISRSALASRLGQTHDGKRDVWNVLGYLVNLSYQDYFNRYDRQDVASAVIDVPVRASWRHPPTVWETEEGETQFEKGWSDLQKSLRLWNYLSRVDRLASIGKYAVLYIGFDDAGPLDQAIGRASRVAYLSVYSEENAVIKTVDESATSDRYGLPETYQLRSCDALGRERQTTVHHSRVVHVSEDNLESDVYGTPKLRKVYNAIQSLELIVGGSPEMFWRGAFPGVGFIAREGTTIEPQDKPALQEQIENYIHGFQRYLRLQGMDVENLSQQVADPSKHFDLIITVVSIVTRIPKRILMGSERGELSSDQDERAWAERVSERRREHCEPTILRPFIDRCVLAGALPKPGNGSYNVSWNDLLAPSPKDKADVGEVISRTVRNYVESGSDEFMPPEFFASEVVGLTPEQITLWKDSLSNQTRDANGSHSEGDGK